MRHTTAVFHFLFALIILLFIFFPPYYAIDTKSNGKIYAAMGYYPVWSKPSPKEAYYCLVNSKKIDVVVFENDFTGNGITRFTANYNALQFFINIIIACAAYFLILLALAIVKRRLKNNIAL